MHKNFKCSPAAEAYARAHGHGKCMDSLTATWCMSVEWYEKEHKLQDEDLQPGAVVNFSRDYTIRDRVSDIDTEITAKEVKKWVDDPHYTGVVTLASKAPVDPRIAQVKAALQETGTFWGDEQAKDILDSLIRQGLIK